MTNLYESFLDLLLFKSNFDVCFEEKLDHQRRRYRLGENVMVTICAVLPFVKL